jgi:hypothetical protein
MATHPQLEILLVTGKGKGSRRLARRLVLLGHRVDLAGSEDEALAAFYRRGGHRVCVIGPLAHPGWAASLVRRLKALDRTMVFLAHPDSLSGNGALPGVDVLPAFHLFSRAGAGALVRELLRREPIARA